MFKTLALSVNHSFLPPIPMESNSVELNPGKKSDGHFDNLTQVSTFEDFIACPTSCYLKKDPLQNRFFSLIKTGSAVYILTHRDGFTPSFRADFTTEPTPTFLREWFGSRQEKGYIKGSGANKQARPAIRVPLAPSLDSDSKMVADFGQIQPVVLLKVQKEHSATIVRELALQRNNFGEISPHLFEEDPLYLDPSSKGRTVYIPTEQFDTNLYTFFAHMRKNPLYRSVNFLSSLLTSIKHVGNIHSQGYVHRDISPRNFLCKLNERTKLDIRITDFGCTVPEDRLESNTSFFASWAYTAPEIMVGQAASTKSDIWSLASHIVTCLTNEQIISRSGCKGVRDDKKKQMLIDRTHAFNPNRCPLVESLPFPSLKALLERMLDKDPSKRPEAAEVIDTVAELVRAIDHIRQSLTTILSTDLEAPLTSKDRTILECLAPSITALYTPSLLEGSHQQPLYNELSNIRKGDSALPLSEDDRTALIRLEPSIEALYGSESSAELIAKLHQSDVTQAMLCTLPIWDSLCAIKPPTITQDMATYITAPSEHTTRRALNQCPLWHNLREIAEVDSWDNSIPENPRQTMMSVLSSRINTYLTLIGRYTATYRSSGIANPSTPVKASHILDQEQKDLLFGHFGVKRMELDLQLNADKPHPDTEALERDLEKATQAQQNCRLQGLEIDYEGKYLSIKNLHDLFKELEGFHSRDFILSKLDSSTIYANGNRSISGIKYRFSAHSGFFMSETPLPTQQTGPFIAPELRGGDLPRQEQCDTESSNIWALGVVLFNNYLLHQLDSAVLKQGTIIDPASPEGRDRIENIQDDVLKAMFSLILSKDPVDRPPLCLLTNSDPGSLEATLETFFAVRRELRSQDVFQYLRGSFRLQPDTCRARIASLHQAFLAMAAL